MMTSHSSSDHVRIALKDGRCIDIEVAERGNRCGCVCAACGHPLVAKKGVKRSWHFAHASRSDCQGMGESHLHRAAKQVISEAKKILLPAFQGNDPLTNSIPHAPMHKDLEDEAKMPVFQERFVAADGVRIEEWLHGIRPDIIIEKDGRVLLVEIKVTHEVDEAKRREIRSRKLPCIEIDLSKTPRDVGLQSLGPIVLGTGGGEEPAPRQWISCPKGEERAVSLSRLRRQELSRRIMSAPSRLRVRAPHGIGSDVVVGCPISVRQGRRHERLIDCMQCKHHVAYFSSKDDSLHAALAADNPSAREAVYCSLK